MNTMKNKASRLVRLCLIVVTVAALMVATTSFAYADVGDTNVVPDPQLQACINVTMLGRAADTPITAAELAGLTGPLSATAYPGITSFEGLQYAKQIGSVTFDKATITDLTPLGQMSNVNAINIQSYTTPDGVVDLTPLAPLAADLISLRLNNSSYDVMTTQIIGLGMFTSLTSLSLNSSDLSELPGLSSLTNLNYLYLNSNSFGNDIIAQIPSKTYAQLNLRYNHISDFTGVPSATSRILGGQYVLGSDVLLASADQDTFTADPADRPVNVDGGPVWISATADDVGPLTFDATDLYSDFVLAGWGIDLSSVPAFTDFVQHRWYVDSSAYSYTFYPVATVDMNDNADLSFTTDTALDEAVAIFNYSVDDPRVPTYTPVSYELASGTLPAGITLDPTTGHLVGTTSEEGTFEFSISATDANGLTVVGAFTATFEKAPVPPADDTDPSIDETKTVDPSIDETKTVDPSTDETKTVDPSIDETKTVVTPPVVSDTATPTAKPLLALPLTGDTLHWMAVATLTLAGSALAAVMSRQRRKRRLEH